jgi:4-hydroxy-2-oxoheptanedioate aldolase
MMLEKQIAVENIDKILMRAKERSVDMIQWGPADYSITRGRPRMMFEADIMPIEELVIGKCLEYGVAPRIEIGDVDQAKRYIDMGVRHFCIGWDRFILQAGLRNIGEGLRKLTDSI